MTGFKFSKLMVAFLAVATIIGGNVVGEEVSQNVGPKNSKPTTSNLSSVETKPTKKESWLRKIFGGSKKGSAEEKQPAAASPKSDASSTSPRKDDVADELAPGAENRRRLRGKLPHYLAMKLPNDDDEEIYPKVAKKIRAYLTSSPFDKAFMLMIYTDMVCA
ncbi:uncharacterized protein BXIN_1206 [Babesia sp. Xinjiang]|uniref:uncharacterized protein n=1 Tax=Babesia sp. Xinjiang TaxID=462227 RepID=UPI000A222CEA|nr:uncharacterized protein BXIN_1206 [Babesia sp. Xinjiang]ORM40117.1 hypothetical protein BXIN_1206 [Babesia sp. Xinjiang]